MDCTLVLHMAKGVYHLHWCLVCRDNQQRDSYGQENLWLDMLNHKWHLQTLTSFHRLLTGMLTCAKNTA